MYKNKNSNYSIMIKILAVKLKINMIV